MTEVDKDFDLLAGHDLADSRTITAHEEEDPEKMDVLVWHKLVTVGYQPSAREVHMQSSIVRIERLITSSMTHRVILQ